MTTPTVTLFMIVKNESKIIERCLSSVKDYVDYIVISDTGSTDNTVELIETFLKTNNIKGKVFNDTWKNFGYNRTKSFKNAQEWLTEQKIDKSNNYAMTIDADMCVVFQNFDKKILSQAQCWQVKQKNPWIEYYNTRLMRADYPFECIGVTHEYWGGVENITHNKLESFFIDDKGDGGAKADKYTRDIALLTKGIEDEPNNSRYFFYLGNSYLDNGQPKDAIPWYQKRIDSGGWDEEVFIAYQKMGQAYMRIEEKEKAIESWMLAYDKLPRRSETLHKIVNHYRVSGKNHLALIFLKKGITIPYPKDLVLFLEYPVYDYLFIDELSIVAYWTNLRKLGRIACQYLMLTRGIPEFNRQQANSNNFFYLEKLSPLQRTLKKLDIQTREPYISTSSSLFFNNKNKTFKGIVRAVNYSMDDKFNYTARDEKNIVKTINYWAEFDANGRTVGCYEIKNDLKPIHDVNVQGLEDVRACFLGNELYAIAVDRENCRNSHPSILFLHFAKDNEHKYYIEKATPITYMDEMIQKNWTIFSDYGKIYCVYGHNPLKILEINPKTAESKVVVEKTPIFDFRDIRGSANPIRVVNENCWLFLVHEISWKDTRKYFHRFIKYSNDWNVIDVSEPFYFENLYVEFSLSLMMDKGKLMIPFSTKDNTTEILTIDYTNIPWLPKDMKKWLSDNI